MKLLEIKDVTLQKTFEHFYKKIFLSEQMLEYWAGARAGVEMNILLLAKARAVSKMERLHNTSGGGGGRGVVVFSHLSEPTSLNIRDRSQISWVTSLFLKLRPCIPCLWKASTLSVKHTEKQKAIKKRKILKYILSAIYNIIILYIILCNYNKDYHCAHKKIFF